MRREDDPPHDKEHLNVKSYSPLTSKLSTMYDMGWQEQLGAGVGDLGHDFQELEDRLRGSEELEGVETSFTTPKNLKISVAVKRILEI